MIAEPPASPGSGKAGGAILAAGESLIDMIAEPQPDGGRLFRPVAGGSPFNVALALGRLRTPVRFAGRFSNDAFGSQLRAALEASGVDLGFCPPTDQLSTLGFVEVDPADGSPRYAFYTRGTAGCGLEPDDVAAAPGLLDGVAAVHFGSFSIGVDPIATALEALLERATVESGGGARFVAVDPNVRPFLVDDREGYLARLGRFLEAATLVKASDEDLAWLEPGAGVRDWCRRRVADDRSATVIALGTLGGGGAFAVTPSGEAEVRAPAVEVADTVGAGDTFQAAALAWLHERDRLEGARAAALDGEALEDLLRFAAAAAAVTVSRKGCDPPWREDVEG